MRSNYAPSKGRATAFDKTRWEPLKMKAEPVRYGATIGDTGEIQFREETK